MNEDEMRALLQQIERHCKEIVRRRERGIRKAIMSCFADGEAFVSKEILDMMRQTGYLLE